MNLGKTIKLVRTRKGMKQKKLAESAGISVSYLSLIEQGRRDPNMRTLEGIANALNVPLSILVFLAADKEELSGIDQELAEKLSYTSLKLIEASTDDGPEIRL